MIENAVQERVDYVMTLVTCTWNPLYLEWQVLDRNVPLRQV